MLAPSTGVDGSSTGPSENRTLTLPFLMPASVQHVRMVICRLHEETASRARADVSAALPNEILHLLAPFRAKGLRLGDGRAAGHHKDVRRVECARAHRRAVNRRRHGILHARRDFKPAKDTTVTRSLVHEHRHAQRPFSGRTGNLPRARPHATCKRDERGGKNADALQKHSSTCHFVCPFVVLSFVKSLGNGRALVAFLRPALVVTLPRSTCSRRRGTQARADGAQRTVGRSPRDRRYATQ